MQAPIRIGCLFATFMFLVWPASQASAQNSNQPGTAQNNNQSGNAKSTNLSSAERHFLTDAIEGDLSEVKMGQLAQQKGQSDATKQFGQMLEQDHSQHLDKAKGMAQQFGASAPSEPNAKQKAMYARLSKLSGNRFDSQFAEAMVNDHKEDISKYRKEADSKGPLADFAQQTVPTLQKHLQTAENLSRGKSTRAQSAPTQ